MRIAKELIAAGRLGDVLELRGHGKEDKRGGGEDLMVLGKDAFDLMLHLVGDAKWCFARIQQGDRKAVAGDERQAGEEIGRIVGDHIVAEYGFAGLAIGSFITHVAKDGVGSRYWLEVRGTKGLLHLGYGVFGPSYFCDDPSWMPGKSKPAWQEITSNGLGKPEALTAKEIDNGNIFIANDLIEAMEKDREPLDGIHAGRAALEMILAAYESHRQERPVDLPLKNRKHPLSG